jgi:hypothetical protein
MKPVLTISNAHLGYYSSRRLKFLGFKIEIPSINRIRKLNQHHTNSHPSILFFLPLLFEFYTVLFLLPSIMENELDNIRDISPVKSEWRIRAQIT